MVSRRRGHSVVLVVGDVGRSPRMQYHALSLARAGQHVTLVGLPGEMCVPELESCPLISKMLIGDIDPRWQYVPFVVAGPLKVLAQIFQLLYTLLWASAPFDTLLVQNPPCIPALAVGRVACWLRNARLVVDWHNLGYSILAIRLGAKSPVVKFARFYERVAGWTADDHFCVTEAMKAWLVTEFGLSPSRIQVLYDHPPLFFRRQTVHERHALFCRLRDTLSLPSSGGLRSGDHLTLFTEKKEEACTATLRKDRPLLVVSSTSWTPDENFALLLDALVLVDRELEAKHVKGLKIAVVVTGKGPEKAHYEARMQTLQLKHVSVATAWLKPEDYPKLLGSADLGVSLHTSSSGLDLPMKVVC